jgi:hypothetical protein
MGGKSPSQVYKEINELKLDNALAKLKSNGVYSHGLETCFWMKGQKDTIKMT